MRFNLKGFLVSVAFCLAVVMALSSGPDWTHAAEATASILIFVSLAGFLRDRHRPS
jgi:uncharacterized membrane protein